MGWLWGSNKPTPPPTSTDPLRDLDPDLRDFLDTETPAPQPPIPPPPAPAQELPPSPPPLAPPQSLYPDGRYAHLWSTYTPLQEVEAATQTDQDRLLDVLDAYKERKAQIARTALENCAVEQSMVDECFRSGGLKARMTMCREDSKGFERCFVMQSRFLKALGFLATTDRTLAKDEEIQMHADTLYHRMLAQERAVEAAKAAGDPVPTFPPMLPSSPPPSSKAVPFPPDIDPLSPAARAQLTKRLEKLPPEERELEERSVSMEARAGAETGHEVGTIWAEGARERRERRSKGEATMGDVISGWFGW